MYGVVLMAALATASNEPAGCWARHGCCAGVSCSCGCSGYSGGHGCHGCWGGTYCYGGYNGYGAYNGCYATHACYGSAYSYYYSRGCYSGYGTCACYNSYLMGPDHPGAMPPAAPAKPPMPAPKPADKKPEGEASAAVQRARIVVDLPADAKLYVDDHLMKSTSAHRNFHTPELEPGLRYFYDVRIEVLRDGKAVTESKRVVLKAGQEVAVSFTNLAESAVTTASATSK